MGVKRQNYFRTNRKALGGPIWQATSKALDELELSGFALVRAEVALDLADLADGCRAKQDPGRFLTTWAKLSGVLDELVGPVVVGGGDGGGDGSGAGGVESDPLADILGSGPAVGDPAES